MVSKEINPLLAQSTEVDITGTLPVQANHLLEGWTAGIDEADLREGILLKIARWSEGLSRMTPEGLEQPDNRLVYVLSEMRQPMHWSDIQLLAETDGFGKINASTTQNCLKTLAREGILIRVVTGIYSLPEFTGEAYESSESNIEARIVTILETVRRPLHLTEIYRLINIDNQDETDFRSVKQTLATLIRLEEIVNSNHGIYATPEFADMDYEPPKPAYDRLLAVVQAADRPLHRRKIHRQAETDGHGPIDKARVKSAFIRMEEKGDVSKTSPGFYRLAKARNN